MTAPRAGFATGEPASSRPSFSGSRIMAKGQQRGNRETRKPKKPEPPKQNASNPSLKGTPAGQPTAKRG
ncbi:hypothetical protein [Sphingomonas sp. ATCC 31555]|uniref:hypothetical protein n=1 Tax=Sphingomonas sp. ATCC 31555 TaxID=194867 RepID=UPI001ED982AD|nr:hypothetical protein [Sphingomonas sp. ATCC 31555]